MTYSCTRPYYFQPDNQVISLIWDHPTLGPIPFHATPVDPEPYGQVIFAEAEAGEYGPLVSYADSHWYSTIDNNVWEGSTYGFASLMTSPLGVQPPNSSNEPIPAPPSNAR